MIAQIIGVFIGCILGNVIYDLFVKDWLYKHF